MDVILYLFKFIFAILDVLLPSAGLSNDFLTAFDSGIGTIIGLINGAGYFIPLNIILLCWTTIFVFDNASILFRIGQWIIGLIRG